MAEEKVLLMPDPPPEVRALDALHRQAMREEERGRALEEVGKTLLGTVKDLARSMRRRRPRPSKRDNRHYVPAVPRRTVFRKLSEAEKDLVRTVAARVGRARSSFGEPPTRIWNGPVSGKAVRRYLAVAPLALNGFKLGGVPLSAALEVARVAYVSQGRDEQFTVCLLSLQPDSEDGETILVGVAHRDRRDQDNYGVGLRLALAHAVEGRSGATTPGEDIGDMAWAAEREARVKVVRPKVSHDDDGPAF